MEKITSAQKNKLALQYGVLTGVIYLVISTAVNLQAAHFTTFYGLKILGYILYFVIIGIFAGQIRKANGGYIEFREIFGAIFIMVLIAATISFVYTYIYMMVIDPHYLEKVKTGTLEFMANMKTPDQKIDEAAKKFDTQIEESKHFSFGKNILTLLGAYIIDSLLGLIVAAIVHKKRPVSGQL